MSEVRSSLIIPATMINSLLTLAPQLVALTTLQAGDFGRFSIVYLVFAWGASLQMSVVCEPVGRDQRRGDGGVIDRDYRAVATYIAIGAGVLAAIATQLLWHEPAITVVLGLAAAAACFRVPARYASLLRGDWRAALVVDLAACVLLIVGGTAAIVLERGAIEVVVWSWGAAMAGACAIGLSPVLRGPGVLSRWFSRRRRDIAPLTLDSLVQDISSIGAPYAIAPILGLANFGLYRAISNVAAPVRLLIEPLRPSWARVDALELRHKLVRAAFVIAAPAGVAAALALESIRFLPWELGVLDELRPWSVAAGAFVTFSLVSLMFYAAARLGGSGEYVDYAASKGAIDTFTIGLAREVGAEGIRAIWSYVLATALGAIVWVVLTRPHGLTRGTEHSQFDLSGS